MLARHHLAADSSVRLSERGPGGHHLLGGVGGVEAGVGQRGLQALAVELQALDHQSRRLQALGGVLDRAEDRRLVLLEVAVVGERQPLEHRGQAQQRAQRSAAPAPNQLGDVRVLLLGHDAGPRRHLVGQAPGPHGVPRSRRGPL